MIKAVMSGNEWSLGLKMAVFIVLKKKIITSGWEENKLLA